MVNNKKKNRRSNRRGGTATAASTVAVPAQAPTADIHGRMPERDGRHFYRLLTLLAAIAVPRMNQEREAAKQDPVRWEWRAVAHNSTGARDLVMTYILQNIDWLVDEIESNRTSAMAGLISSILGRRLTTQDRNNIRSWKLHVKDDFFVVGHRPKEGAVLAQVGRLQHRDLLKSTAPDFLPDGEYHEPRLFVIQGLSESLENLVTPVRQRFHSKFPSIGLKYPDYVESLCLIHTALLPYNGGITYLSTFAPVVVLGSTQHHNTPQDLLAAVDKAVDAHQKGFLHDTTQTIALYRSLDPERDASICRLANAVPNQGGSIPLIYRSPEHGVESSWEQQSPNPGTSSPTVTEIMVSQVVWSPLQNRNDPQFEILLEKVMGGTQGTSDEPFVCEGVKNFIGQQFSVQDDDPCPFHRHYGRTDQSFVQCCKASYQKQVKRALKKHHELHYMYNPLEENEVEKLNATFANSTSSVNIMPHIRLGLQDCGNVRLQFDPREVDVIQFRMHSMDSFHSVVPNKWLYWGYAPIPIQDMGLVSFGDVLLDPTKGELVAEAMTAGQLGALIRELKHVCTGLSVLKAELEMTPSYRTRTDPVAFEKNRELLQQGLTIEIRATVNKEANEAMGLHCGFCGVTEYEIDASLLRCPCKRVWYCGKEHQRQHWKDHREECRRHTATPM